MASTNNYFAALIDIATNSDSSEAIEGDDGFTEIRRKRRPRKTTPSSTPAQDRGSKQQRPSSTNRPKGAASDSRAPTAGLMQEADLANAISSLRIREESLRRNPHEQGDPAPALSYAAVTADSSAPQQLPVADPPAAESAQPVIGAEKAAGKSAADTSEAAAAAAGEATIPGAAPKNGGADRTSAPTAAADTAVHIEFCRSTLHRGGSSRQSKSGLKQPLVWLDLEMTGLDLENDTIIEAACLMSDGSLETIIEGPEIAIQQSEEVLSAMNPWCIEHHGASGLTQRCRVSTVSIEQAEEQLLDFVAWHTEPGEARLAGNSVHVDMQFLRRRMPRLFAHLHHRIVDVSTVAELCARWFPTEYRRAPRKQGAHTALADVRDSVEELRFYKSAIFKQPSSQQRRRR